MRNLTELEARELRVLGALMEKEQTTPDYYPMTLNSLVAACNQKTNRNPVMSLGQIDVLNVLRVLLQEGLVERVRGARADRWSHRVDEKLSFKPDRRALLTVLFLRGPQTPGELRVRTERMHPFDSSEEVESVLQDFSQAENPLVVELARRPGQKESRWALAGQDHELAPPRTAIADEMSPTPSSPDVELRIDRLEKAVEKLQREIGELRELWE